MYFAPAEPIYAPRNWGQQTLAAAIVMTVAMVDAAFGATAAQTTPEDADPFQAGDFVVYPAHGVGKVERMGPEEVAGHKLDLIHISFAENRMTLRIPAAQARASGLRKIATAEALAAAMDTLRERPRISRIMWTKRAQGYLAKINSGDLRSLAEVVRDLQAAGDGSGTSFSQRNLFELAIDRLGAEVAVASRSDKTATIGRLTALLQHVRETATKRAERVPGADIPAI